MTITLGVRSAQLILESAVLVRRMSDRFPRQLPQLRFPCGLPMGEVETEIQGTGCPTCCLCRDVQADRRLRTGEAKLLSRKRTTAGSSLPSAACTL